MSLEERIAELTAAISENTKRLDKMLGGATAKTEDKPATKPAAGKPADKPATKPAAGSKAKPKAVTAQDVADFAGTYMKEGDDEDRANAKANIKRIVEHFGADRLTNIDAAEMGNVLAMLKAFQSGEDPLGDEEGEEEDGDDSVI